MTDIPVIEGIDCEAAIKAMGGHTEGYKKLLGSFRRDIPYKIRSVKEAYASNDLETFTVFVHGIKGSSKMLGLNEISGMFLKLEEAGNKGDKAFVDENLSGSLSAYEKYYEILMPFDDREKEEVSEGVSEYEPLVLLSRIKELLEDFEDEEALKKIEELGKCSFTGVLKEKYEELYEAADRVDYYGAIDAAGSLASEIMEKLH
ncbi:MAG: Hpt domain-containing protein [Lachnospiraceae bacterium]|nr:Hpt domain-containing protein [Lachnospiraceae bacterium]